MKGPHFIPSQSYVNIQLFRLPPIVQNCPYRFSDATLNPLLNVVTRVEFCSDLGDA